jgi:glutamyl-tRNA synthetase/nondiscriminating glutamyl-tRNA synthetase
MEKLYWLNRHYIKASPPERIEKLAHPYFSKLIGEMFSASGAKQTTDSSDVPDAKRWLANVVQLLVPSVDRLDQLPEKASLIFNYDATAALASPDNAEVLAWPQTDAVLALFTYKILEDESAREGKLTPEQFKKIVNEVKAETGAKGKELFHPIRLVVTGSHSGPEFDKLIPILEEGSHLPLPNPVLNLHQRVSQFAKTRGK